MITSSWYLLLLMILVGASVLHLPMLVAFTATLLVVFGLARLWNRFALREVHYLRRWRYRRGFPGETLDVQIVVENRKALPLSWLRVSDGWPKAVGPEDENILAPSHIPDQGYLINLYSLRWYQKAMREYHLRLAARGIYPIGPYALESGDLFGLHQSTRAEEQIDYVTVFPELIDLPSVLLPGDDPFGDRATRRRLFEDPTRPMGIRPYHPEDDFRRIHWPATARTGSLQTRVYQPVSAQVLVIFLNVTTLPHHWLGTDPDLLEQLVKTCASLAMQRLDAGYAVGLYSNGSLAHADQPFRIPPGRSRRQAGQILQALAGVTSYVAGSFEGMLLKTLGQIPYRSTLAVLTALVSPELVEILLSVRKYHPRTALISLSETPPPDLPGIGCVHLPYPGAK